MIQVALKQAPIQWTFNAIIGGWGAERPVPLWKLDQDKRQHGEALKLPVVMLLISAVMSLNREHAPEGIGPLHPCDQRGILSCLVGLEIIQLGRCCYLNTLS